MKNKLLFLFVLCFTFMQTEAQNDTFWTSYSNQNGKIIETDQAVSRETFPKQFNLFALNIDVMRQTLFANLNKVSNQKIVITLPNVAGQLEQFEIFEASNFEADLQAQFPDIRAYSGKGLSDPHATLKLSISPQGIQTMIFRTGKPNEFIEPYSKDHTIYAVFKSERTKGKLAWSCTTDDKNLVDKLGEQLPSNLSSKISDTTLRTIRLAQSCNGEYANYFGAYSSAQVGLVIAAFNATLTRCNGVYEKDLALHLNLVSSTTNLIYYNTATDPYSTTLSAWNTQLQNAISTTLTGPSTTLVANNAAYDIGHMFGATGGGGNAGCIGCVCVNATAAGTGSTKGRGITSPSNGIPQGDTFDIDYVVHEIGHQLGGTHTFSHNNEGSGTNMEVGSGVTIMGYAGITSNDVAPNSIDKYHAVTIAQIQANLQTKTCPVSTNISANNAAPTVNAGLDFVIPISTPYVLTAIGADANAGNALTYSWEQFDDGAGSTGTASSASATKTVGPNFISWDATASPSRYFPQIESIVANATTTDQVGGDAGMLSESLSAVSRELNFRVTVRDNVPYSSAAPITVGQTNFDDMKITVNAAAGPFVVTSPDSALSWTAGTNQNVTWNVAGTNANGVNVNFVDIYLSIDGGFTYPIQLANKVPNDGSEVISVPNFVGSNNRIMVKGNNHVFFDISNAAFSITAPSASFLVSQASIQTIQACMLATITFNFTYQALAGFSGVTTFTATGTPAGASVVFSPASATASGNVSLTLDNLSGTSGNFNITITATAGAVTKTVPCYLYLGLGTPTLTAPVNNAVTQNTTLNLTWTADPNASSYDVQVATSAAFTTIVSSANVTSNGYAASGLLQGTAYFWRVAPKSASCTSAFGTPFKFTTGVVSCATFTNTTPLTIPATITAVFNGTSTISIPTGTAVSDVNVIIDMTHTWINDLTVFLTSPAGTAVQLFARQCNPAVSVNDVNATFDDSGVAVVCGDFPGISGVVVPLQSLSAFNGQNPVGNWVLTVRDSFNGDGGFLNSWGIAVCNLSALGLTETTFQDFSLFPNPNNGQFNIKFSSGSNDAVTIRVNDVSGRQVFEKVFSNDGFFDQNLNLDYLQTGVYLVTIGDGTRKIVKKIVIK